MKKVSILFLAIIFLISCTGQNQKSESKKQCPTPKIIMTNQQLMKYGFENLDAGFFKILFTQNFYYLLNTRDNNIIRFRGEGGKISGVRQYKAAGNGPGEFDMANNIFIYNRDTIAVFDYIRKRVFLFDMDLNYKKEIKVSPSINKIASVKNVDGFVAFGFFKDKIFAVLDKNFEIKETFAPFVTKSRLNWRWPLLLNKGFFLNDNEVVYTPWVFENKECQMDIFQVDSKKIKLSLKWQWKRRMTERERKLGAHYYGSYLLEKYGKYYVALNSYKKVPRGKVCFFLLVFGADGKLKYKYDKFPYCLIVIENAPMEKLFLLTQEGDLAYIELDKLVDL